MDDPWANAWGEPAKPLDSSPWSASPHNSASNAVSDDQEDIGLPSWATGPGVQWAEPSEDPHQSSLWSQPSATANGWEASPYDSIPIGKASIPDLHRTPPHTPSQSPPRSPEPPEPQPLEITPPSPPLPLEPQSPSQPVEPSPLPSPIDDSSFPLPETPSPPPSPPPVPASPPLASPDDSPDAFGVFESGLRVKDEIEDPWTPSRSAFDPISASSNAWGAAWTPNPEEEEQQEEEPGQVDEWEAAKRQKERQDRQVPPELLASILRQFEELSHDLWASEEVSTEEGDFRNNRRSGMEGVEGLTPIITRLIPEDLTLPALTPFPKTFTSKYMSDALRLTRHVPLTRGSPMAQYVASKGSTAWETSVKNRPEIVQEDLLPPGWRVVERDKEKEDGSQVNVGKKKTGGGLLSFLGRRAATPPIEGTSSRSSSPVRPPAKTSISSVGIGSVSSPRQSIDTTTSNSAMPLPAIPTPVSPLVASSPGAPLPATAALTPTPPQLPHLDLPPAREPTPPPSAVSRFLNRFSRSKSSTNSSRSPRNSLALSSDDLEFLSDIVPSAGDEDADEGSQLKALSSMIQSSPLPTKLPPPLAPPPRPPPQPTRVSNGISNGSASGRTSGLHSRSQSSSSSLSLFDSTGSIMQPSAPPSIPLASTPAPLLPPLSPMTPSTMSSGLNSPPLFMDQNQNIEPMQSSSPPLPAPPNKPSSPFDFLPPPSSRMQTPVPPRSPVTAIMSGTTTNTIPPPPPKSNSPSSFVFPPPSPSSSSRVHTPISPPPRRSPVTAIMSSHSTPPPAPKPSFPSFTFPPPPSTQTPVIRPPPSAGSSRSPMTSKPLPPPKAPAPSRPVASLLNDDDFSDFYSPPANATPANKPFPKSTSRYDSSFSSSYSSDQDLFPHSITSSNGANTSSSMNAFDDFDDFVSSPIRTPSPPRPPAKPSPFARRPPPPPSIPVTAPTPPPQRQAAHRRPSRAADHQRTMSLVESAAARPGMWPAPASPLPEALPPPGSIQSDPFEVDFFSASGGTTMQTQQAQAISGMGMAASASSPAALAPPRPDLNGLSKQLSFPPPPRGNTSSPPVRALSPLGSKKPMQPPTLTMDLPAPSPPASGKPGVLSAQDLSFFEGL